MVDPAKSDKRARHSISDRALSVVNASLKTDRDLVPGGDMPRGHIAHCATFNGYGATSTRHVLRRRFQTRNRRWQPRPAGMVTSRLFNKLWNNDNFLGNQSFTKDR